MTFSALLIFFYHQLIFQLLFFWKTFSLNNFLNTSVVTLSAKNIRFSLVFILFLSVCLSSASSSVTYQTLLPVNFMDRGIADLITFFSLTLSIRILFVVLYESRRSWRIGINHQEKTDLMVDGIFRISRNPLMLCYFLTVLGYSMMIPNMAVIMAGITFLYFGNCLVLTEENYLESKHKNAYLKYKQEVGRYL